MEHVAAGLQSKDWSVAPTALWLSSRSRLTALVLVPLIVDRRVEWIPTQEGVITAPLPTLFISARWEDQRPRHLSTLTGESLPQISEVWYTNNYAKRVVW